MSTSVNLQRRVITGRLRLTGSRNCFPDRGLGARHTTQGAAGTIFCATEPPAWLAETMNDPQRGAEARALWEAAQRAEREAASYREVFAKARRSSYSRRTRASAR